MSSPSIRSWTVDASAPGASLTKSKVSWVTAKSLAIAPWVTTMLPSRSALSLTSPTILKLARFPVWPSV